MFLISIFLFIIFLSPSRHSASYDGYFYIVLLLGKNFGLAYPYDVKPQKEYRSIFLRHMAAHYSDLLCALMEWGLCLSL